MEIGGKAAQDWTGAVQDQTQEPTTQPAHGARRLGATALDVLMAWTTEMIYFTLGI